MTDSGKVKKISVCILMPPVNYSLNDGKVSGYYHDLPYNMLLIYHRLLQAGTEADVLNFNYALNDKNRDFEKFSEEVRSRIIGKNYQYFIIPAIYTKDYSYFSDVNLDLIGKILGMDIIFDQSKVIVIGRLIHHEYLKKIIHRDFSLVHNFYSEEDDIVKMIFGEAVGDKTIFQLKPDIENSFHLKDTFHYLKEFTVITQKGCLLNCSFCELDQIWPDKKIEKINLDFIKAIIQFIHKNYGVNKFAFSDPVFNTSKEHILLISNLMKGLKLKWRCQAKADMLDEDIIRIMKGSGCYCILFGIESLTPEVQKDCGKVLDLDKVKKTIQYCRKYRLKYHLTVIVGMGKTVRDSYADAPNILKTPYEIYKINQAFFLKIHPVTI